MTLLSSFLTISKKNVILYLAHFKHMKKSEQDTGEQSFRCPFEIIGNRKKTIINIILSESREQRFKAVKEAFIKFHHTPSSPGIRFILPKIVLDQCSSIKDLKMIILPYQTEVIAAELDYRLYPFLSYHLGTVSNFDHTKVLNKDTYLFDAARILNQGARFTNVFHIANWLYELISTTIIEGGARNPTFKIRDSAKDIDLITISPGYMMIHYEQVAFTDFRNKNCFSLVKTPFYPQALGRYSENVEIVLSREHDFTSLSKEVRQKIREASNKVLRKSGIPINNLKEDKPEGEGLWIPELEEWI